jgi:hypothetical protein
MNSFCARLTEKFFVLFPLQDDQSIVVSFLFSFYSRIAPEFFDVGWSSFSHPSEGAGNLTSCTTLSVYVILSKIAYLLPPFSAEAGAKVLLFTESPNFFQSFFIFYPLFFRFNDKTTKPDDCTHYYIYGMYGLSETAMLCTRCPFNATVLHYICYQLII